MPTESGASEKNIQSSLIHASRKLLDSFVERIATPRHEKRNRRILLLLTAFFLTLLIIPSQEYLAVRYKAGDIATSDIRATRDYILEDKQLTQRKRAEAEGKAPFVYSYNTKASNQLSASFVRALEIIKEFKADSGATVDTKLRESLHEALGTEVSPQEVTALLRVKSDKALLEGIDRLIESTYGRKVVADGKSFERDLNHGVVFVDSETQQIIGGGDASIAYIEITDVRRIIDRMKIQSGAAPRDLETIKGILSKMVKPDISFHRNLTEERRRQASREIRPVFFQVKSGEMIVRAGDRVTEEQILKLEKIFDARHGINKLFSGIGLFGLVLVLFFFPYRFARKNIRKFNPTIKDLFLISVMTVFNFLVMKTLSTISMSLGGAFPHIDTGIYFYLFPFAVVAMLVRIILNSEVAMVYCAICAPLTGILLNNSLTVVIYALLGGVIGAHGVRHCKDRSVIYTAGMKISVVNVCLALCFQIFNDSLLSMQTIYAASFALASGIINATIVTGTIPLIESLFHYTTDIKLLELANLNSPTLRELMVRAPGTYHHSVLVGTMVETAAEAINANPLLARVAAYYHDIGKSSKPLYFIENIAGGENRHDKLKPNMSALILISHVKEGVETAKEKRLGLPIVDIIRQSHGTALINFFYQKAKKLAGAEAGNVNEQDFRYPGPKPQTREAGLVMLADAVEAASRTLIDPTPARIQGMVQKIINNIFIDGQLDECELTLNNLHEIAKSFNKVLAGIHHQRIDYPEPAYKSKSPGGKKSIDHSDSEPSATPPDSGEDTEKSSGEDLKRLGMFK